MAIATRATEQSRNTARSSITSATSTPSASSLLTGRLSTRRMSVLPTTEATGHRPSPSRPSADPAIGGARRHSEAELAPEILGRVGSGAQLLGRLAGVGHGSLVAGVLAHEHGPVPGLDDVEEGLQIRRRLLEGRR